MTPDYDYAARQNLSSFAALAAFSFSLVLRRLHDELQLASYVLSGNSGLAPSKTYYAYSQGPLKDSCKFNLTTFGSVICLWWS